ncbi:MAG TPA: 30S ribosome-binding factor RbfA [Thermoanaerobaculia bacterium]|nr:30S ribosome-binding factor RbfA [Thermoanaerobaculia bacterium]
MKKTRRTSKVGELVRDALVDVFRHDLKTDLGFTSITEVEVSPDLHFAHVYISGLKEDETRHTVERLQELRGRVRKFLGARIRLRYTPELDFRYDETTMRASRIEAILTQVKREDEGLKTADDEREPKPGE